MKTASTSGRARIGSQPSQTSASPNSRATASAVARERLATSSIPGIRRSAGRWRVRQIAPAPMNPTRSVCPPPPTDLPASGLRARIPPVSSPFLYTIGAPNAIRRRPSGQASHASFGLPAATIEAGGLASVTSTSTARRIQSGMKFGFREQLEKASRRMKRLRLPGILLLLAIVASDARPAQKLRITMISFGDDLENKTWIKDYKQNYHTKAKIEESFRRLKDEGFSVIYWRMLWEGLPIDEIEFYSHRVQMEAAQLRKELENTPYAWDPHELRWPIEVAHRLGLKLYAWIVPYNMGAPPGASKELGRPPNPIRFPYGTVSDTEFGYYASFLRKHPEYQLVDRTGKRYHYGVLEWAYPEARRYWTDIVSALMAKYDLDGIYMDTRTECMAPDFADQFGFNEPVVAEYKRRYGVDIREEDFDLEKWRTLRGEYFTRFVREMSAAVRGRGKPLSLGTNRGDYIGFP